MRLVNAQKGKVNFIINYCIFTEKVTAADIQRVAQRLLNSVPSVAARGDIENLPELAHITNALSGSGRSIGRRLSLFK